MIIERIKQRQFINDELKAQTDEFKKKLDSSAIDLLLDKHELFVALFLKFTEERMIIIIVLPYLRALEDIKTGGIPHMAT